MHPFPPADEFQCLPGQVIEQVSFNPFQTQFNFDGGGYLALEHRLSHIEPDGTAWEYDCTGENGPPLALHRLLMKPVVAVKRQDLILTLELADGAKLVVFSEIGPYESGQFDNGAGRYLVF